MVSGKSVRLFLVDGTPGGLLTAEIMNWTGHVVSAPRSEIGELLKREEGRRTGVYVLLGDDPDALGGLAAYIGEADDISTRLRAHSKPGEVGGKDFWDRVVILTSKDANLTKAHARYLESRLISTAHLAKRSHLKNETAPQPIQLPEADRSDMEYFISQVLLVFPVLGINMFRAPRTSAPAAAEADKAEILESPEFELRVPRHGIHAKAREVDGEFTVLEGSLARSQWSGIGQDSGYRQLHGQLVMDGSVEPASDGLVRFTRDVRFSSPSGAGAVVTGRSCNGRVSWVNSESGETFGDWQNRDVEAPMGNAEMV